MSAALERRYRAALDWYPKGWRDENGEAMLGTLLDEAEATGREKPRLGDLLNLALHGIGAQFTRLSLAVPARVRDRVSAITLGTGFAFALTMFVGVEWAPWAERGPWNGWIAYWPVDVPGFGPFASAAAGLYALWIAAFVFAIVGLPRLAVVALLFTIPASAVIIDLGSHAETSRFVTFAPDGQALVMLGLLAAVASIGLATRPGQRAGGSVWLLLSATIAILLVAAHELPKLHSTLAANAGWAFENRLDAQGTWASLIDPAGVLAVMVVAAVIFVARSRYEWAIAVVVAAVPWALAFVAIALNGGGSLSGAVVAVLLTVVAAAVAYRLLQRRGYRIVLQRTDDTVAAASVPPAS